MYVPLGAPLRIQGVCVPLFENHCYPMLFGAPLQITDVSKSSTITKPRMTANAWMFLRSGYITSWMQIFLQQLLESFQSV